MMLNLNCGIDSIDNVVRLIEKDLFKFWTAFNVDRWLPGFLRASEAPLEQMENLILDR